MGSLGKWWCHTKAQVSRSQAPALAARPAFFQQMELNLEINENTQPALQQKAVNPSRVESGRVCEGAKIGRRAKGKHHEIQQAVN